MFAHVQHLAQSTPEVIGLRLYFEEDNVRAKHAYLQLGLKLAGYAVMEHIFRNDVAGSAV